MIGLPTRRHSLVVGVSLLLLAPAVQAQATTAAIDFDALPRRSRIDSTAAKKKDPVVLLREQNAAQRDSIAQLTRALAQAKARVDTVVVTAPAKVDTVVVEPVTVKGPAVAEPARPSTPPAAQVAVSPTTTVSGLLQLLGSGGDLGAQRSTFRLRRAEIKMVSDLGGKTTATLMIDVSKALALSTAGPTPSVTQSTRVIQDAVLSMPIGRVQFEAGQQRLPLGLEGSHSSSILETVERSLMTSDRARGASFGDVRDLGLMAKGKFVAFEYKAGVFNGSGEAMNETDKNSGKAVAAQLIWRPKSIRGFRIGTSGVTSGTASGDKPTRDRAGLDLQYVRGRALLQVEGMAGRDGAIVRHGMYALGTWAFRPTVKGALRFDAWDPNANLESTPASITERDYTLGLTWAPKGTKLRLMTSMIHKTYAQDLTPAATLVLTQLQANW